MSVFVIPDAIDALTMESLRLDCDLQFEKIVNFEDKSCVVDLFEYNPLPDSGNARLNIMDYCNLRWTGSLLPDIHKQRIMRLIFEIIPKYISQIYKWNDIYLFNEHYIVKTSDSLEEFKWHIDAMEQLMMFPYSSIFPYLSIWLPLDDCDENNGTLTFSNDVTIKYINNQEDITVLSSPILHSVTMNDLISIPTPDNTINKCDDMNYCNHNTFSSEIPLIVTAGTLVLFPFNMYHRSNSNQSPYTRRVFYIQYSNTIISLNNNNCNNDNNNCSNNSNNNSSNNSNNSSNNDNSNSSNNEDDDEVKKDGVVKSISNNSNSSSSNSNVQPLNCAIKCIQECNSDINNYWGSILNTVIVPKNNKDTTSNSNSNNDNNSDVTAATAASAATISNNSSMDVIECTANINTKKQRI